MVARKTGGRASLSQKVPRRCDGHGASGGGGDRPATGGAGALGGTSDDGGLADLFAAHYPAVVRHLAYLLDDRAAAEDIAQEVFLRWHRSGPRGGDPGPWLRVAATHLAYNYLRDERRRRAREVRAAEDAPPPDGVGVADEWPAVRAALQRLEPRDRLVLLLRAQGQSYAEIAAAVGLRPSSVGTVLARATARLRQVYGGEAGTGRSPRPSTMRGRMSTP